MRVRDSGFINPVSMVIGHCSAERSSSVTNCHSEGSVLEILPNVGSAEKTAIRYDLYRVSWTYIYTCMYVCVAIPP